MTREWLEEYIDNAAKIEYLIEKKRKLPKISDTVRGSDEEYPYAQRTLTIGGVDRKTTEKINKEIAVLREKCEAVERLIDGVKKTRIQNILRWRYLDGESWAEIGYRLGKGADAVRKMARRYLDGRGIK